MDEWEMIDNNFILISCNHSAIQQYKRTLIETITGGV